jgi:hypothetical protein
LIWPKRLLGRYFNLDSNKHSNKKENAKYFKERGLHTYTIAFLRRWLWVRAPPNPRFFCRITAMAWVYILRGSSGRHSIGSTINLERRFTEHRSGGSHTTQRLDEHLETVAVLEVDTIKQAQIPGGNAPLDRHLGLHWRPAGLSRTVLLLQAP